MKTENPNYAAVFAHNRAWAAKHTGRDSRFFEQLSKGQSPEFLFIGCADSRVPASQVMGMGPGEAFVHRNIANMAPHGDLSAQAVIAYAVTHLGVKHVVVCGHSGCGGVQAALSSDGLGVIDPWLREIKDVILENDALVDGFDGAARVQAVVELNVRRQCLNVMKSAPVQARWAQGDGPTVHGWVYDLASGLLNDLDLDFTAEIALIRSRFAVT